MNRVPTRVRTTATALAALAALAAAPAAAQDAAANLWNLRYAAEGGLRYDDNILSLSERDQDFLEANEALGQERFGVESPDDMIFIPELSAALERNPRSGAESGISLLVRGHQYLENSAKDYQEIALTFRQEVPLFGRLATRLSAGFDYIPEYFVRRLIDEDASVAAGTTIRNDVDYEKTQFRIGASQEIVNRMLDVELRYAWADRDYNDNFNERDSDADVFDLDVSIYPLRSIAFLVRPYYENESRDAAGDIVFSPAVADDDVGYDADLYGLELRWLWGPERSNLLQGYYEQESRDFATTNPADTGHFGREDEITKYGLRYEREMGQHWEFAVSGYHRVNEVSFPDGRLTDYPKNVITATFGYRSRQPL